MRNGVYITIKGELVLISNYLKNDGYLLIETKKHRPHKYINYKYIKVLIESCEYLGELWMY